METPPIRFLTEGHQQALYELGEVADADPTALELLTVEQQTPSGLLPVLISLCTAGSADGVEMMATGPGARMRARERFMIYVPHNFPFNHPVVSVPHERFAGLPHVQWRRWLCLYISPSTEWQPADGMFGFLERLLLWVSRAAAGTLDALGEPLHPPVAYPTDDAGVVVVRANTPSAHGQVWMGCAVLQTLSATRVDIVGWIESADAERLLGTPPLEVLGPFVTGIEGMTSLHLGMAILLPEATAYEFPSAARSLIAMLANQGVAEDTLLDGFSLLAHLNRRLASQLGRANWEPPASMPVYVIVGTPMRGTVGGELLQHLAAWRLSDLGQQVVDLLETRFSDIPDRATIAAHARDLLRQWLAIADVQWTRVYDTRPEVTTRRDIGSPLALMRGQRVLVLGCGAIGGQVAEHIVRAGAARIVLVDSGRVAPGVLVRQLYDDADIGRWKAEALADRLRRIGPAVTVDTNIGDALGVMCGHDTPLLDTDLIVDATANLAVASCLERWRRGRAEVIPPILSFLLGHTACRGVVTIAPTGYSGGGADLLRKVKIAALAAPNLRAFANDFFPDPPRSTHFQPEPGCSEATFVGSHADVAAVTATLLAHALALCKPPSDARPGSAVLLDLGLDAHAAPVVRRLSWPADVVNRDVSGGMESRLSPTALTEMRAECRLMARRRGVHVEVGGLLLGEIDDACGVAWVSVASGPPPDSRVSAQAFVCGVEGVEAFVHQRDQATRGAMRFVGIWHSHPAGEAAPSAIDEEGMQDLLVPVARTPRHALLLILGASPSRWMAWLQDQEGDASPDLYVRLCHRTVATRELTSAAAPSRYTHTMALLSTSEARRWLPPDRPGRIRQAWRWMCRGRSHEA